MPTASNEEHDSGLPAAGSRWGSGAQSVLPYLTRTLQAKPMSAPEQPREAKPAADPRSGRSDAPPSPHT